MSFIVLESAQFPLHVICIPRIYVPNGDLANSPMFFCSMGSVRLASSTSMQCRHTWSQASLEPSRVLHHRCVARDNAFRQPGAHIPYALDVQAVDLMVLLVRAE